MLNGFALVLGKSFRRSIHCMTALYLTPTDGHGPSLARTLLLRAHIPRSFPIGGYLGTARRVLGSSRCLGAPSLAMRSIGVAKPRRERRAAQEPIVCGLRQLFRSITLGLRDVLGDSVRLSLQ